MVPAAPGGGWDQTARAMQNVLQEELASRIPGREHPGRRRDHRPRPVRDLEEGKGNAVMTGGAA